MVPHTDFFEIENRKVAIRPNTTEMYLERGQGAPTNGRRELYDNWFVDKPGGLEEKIFIYDGIEVNITAKGGPDRELKYTWHIIGYNEHFIWFKFDFEQPESASEYENFDEMKITFWETKYFFSTEGKQMGFGTSVTWGMYR